MSDFERVKEILQLSEQAGAGEKLLFAAELSEIAAKHDMPGDGEFTIHEIMDFLSEEGDCDDENSK